MRFLRGKGWVERVVKRVVRGRSKSGGKRVRRTEGGGMLDGGGGAVAVGFSGGEVTWSAASQAHASASIPEVGFGVGLAGDSGGRSAKSPQSSSGWLSRAGESRYISMAGGSNDGHAVMGEAVLAFSSFFTAVTGFIDNPKLPNGFLSWKEGDFGAWGYGKPEEFRLVGNKLLGLLVGFGSNVVAPNIRSRD